MADSQSEDKKTPEKNRLQTAMAEAREAQAMRFDAVSEVHHRETARLDALADELAPVFAEIPESNALFVCKLVAGEPPRLWIDVLCYVALAEDGRTFRLIMNAREGQRILAETKEIPAMAGHVTSYVAHRIIDMERAGVVAPVRIEALPGYGYSLTTVVFAAACGCAVGALLLFAFFAGLSGAPQ